MADVFVSYRRADGPYGVGWIAERLDKLDSITGVEPAFHDSELRAGSDFPDALDAEIASSNLMLAVIGPKWHGLRPDGTTRINDPGDWVVREIASALAQGKPVVPVLIGGTDHPLESEVHPSIAVISRLHSLPFNDGDDLDKIVEHIESHLLQIAQDSATRAGLEEPIEVPTLEHPKRLAVLTTCSVAIGMVLAAISAYLDADGTPGDDGLADQIGWAWYGPLLLVLGGFAGGSAVVGMLLTGRVIKTARHRWSQMIGSFALAGTTVAVMILSADSGHLLLTRSDSINHAEWRGISNAIVAILAMAPLGIALASPIFSTSRADAHDLRSRVLHLGIARDAERWGALGMAVIVAVSTGIGAALIAGSLEADELSRFEPFPLVGFAVIMSMILIMTHATAVSRLRDRQDGIERDLAELPPRYRANATPQLMAAVFDDGGWGFRTILALPAIISVLAVALIAAF